MKNIFILFILILSLIFTSCDDKYGEYGNKGQGGGIIFFAEGGQYMECSGELGNNTWIAAYTNTNNYNGGGYTDWRLPTRSELDLMYKNLHKNKLGGFSKSRYWTLEANNNVSSWALDFYNGSKNWWSNDSLFGVRAVRSYTNEPEGKTRLTIKNQSSKEIFDVRWNNINFTEGSNPNSIKSGYSAVKNVEAGGSYIFFKLGTISYQTQSYITIEEGKKEEFVFNNNTVVYRENINLPVMLGGL